MVVLSQISVNNLCSKTSLRHSDNSSYVTVSFVFAVTSKPVCPASARTGGLTARGSRSLQVCIWSAHLLLLNLGFSLPSRSQVFKHQSQSQGFEKTEVDK